MPKKKTLNDEERQIVEELKQHYTVRRNLARDDSKDRITHLVMQRKFGERITTGRVYVDWDSLLEENICPYCGETISLRVDTYKCPECFLEIPEELYTDAEQLNEQELLWAKRDREIFDKFKALKLGKGRVEMLYQTAMLESQALEKEKKDDVKKG